MRLAFDARMASWGGVGTYTRELLAALIRDAASLDIEQIVVFHHPGDSSLFRMIADRLGPGAAADTTATARGATADTTATARGATADSGDSGSIAGEATPGLADLAALAGGLIEWRPTAGSPWSPKANMEVGLSARGHADVFHALHFPVPLGFPGALVTTIHDLIPILVPESMPDPVRRGAFASMVRWAIGRSHLVICVARAAGATVAQRFPDARVVVIHHGVHVPAQDAGVPTAIGTPDPSRGWSGSAGGPAPADPAPGYVLWVSAFKPHKDVRTLLSAHRRLPPDVRDHHPLVLVGDDSTPEGASVRRDVARTPDELGRRVHILGPVPADRLPRLYRAAAVFAFPSRVEGFGMPPLEAMAHGTPVIAAAAQPLPEILGEAALYFPAGDDRALADRLLTVLEDPAQAPRLCHLGALRVRRYTWERTARETTAAYRLALGIHHGRSGVQ